jgi:rubrerythrin
MDKLKCYIKETGETLELKPTLCVYGEMPEMNIPGNSMNTYKYGEYDPVARDNTRCSHLNSLRTDKVAEIMNDEQEHPIVRGLAKEEYLRRLIRDFVPDTKAGETKEDKMAEILEDTINNCSFDQKKMAEHFSQYAHRYLDQSLFDGFIRWYIVLHAKKYRDGRYDGRNKWACECCNKIVELLEWEYYVDNI